MRATRHAAVLAALLFPAPLQASDGAAARWPEKPVRLIVGAPPGGTLDAVSRVVGERLAGSLRQPFVVDFRPGASGTIAADAVVRSKPDGYTLLVAPNGLLTEVPHTVATRFDPLADLEPVAELARSSLVLVSRPDLPAGSLHELIAYVKARPGTFAYASYSPGSASHYAGLILNQLASTDLMHVGYRGSPPALADLAGGHVALMFDALVTSVPLVKAKRLRAYAVTGEKRSSFLPEVPTFSELGYAELWMSGWVGVFAPRGLEPQLAARIHFEFIRALASPGVQLRLAGLYFDPSPPSLPAELARALRTEYNRAGAVVKTFDIRPE